MLFNPQLIQTGKYWGLDSRALAMTLAIPAIVMTTCTGGYAATGDGGGAQYKRVAVQPAHSGKFQSADGAWWEINETTLDVRMLGAKGDGVADDFAAFQSAVNISRNVFISPGTYKVVGLVQVANAKTKVKLGPNVTINFSGYMWNGTQTPFGNHFNVTAPDCTFEGSGASSVINLVLGDQGNAIGALHVPRLTVTDIVFDGGMANVTGFTDDTFGSAISLLGASVSGQTVNGNHIITRNVIRNFIHYGLNVYGDKVGGTKIFANEIYSMGKAGDALSIGAPIVITRSGNNVSVFDNTLYDCKYHAVFISSAGINGFGIKVHDNTIYNTQRDGISVREEANLASVASAGLYNISITNNSIFQTAGASIRLGTYDNVGWIINATVSGNICDTMTIAAVLVQSNPAPNHVGYANIGGNIMANLPDGVVSVFISPNAVGCGRGDNIENGIPSSAQGSFVPVIQGTGDAGVGTYNVQLGKFTRVDNMVFFQVVLDWTAHTGTGNMRIAGFPIPANIDEPTSPNFCFANNITVAGQLTVSLTGGAKYGDFGAVNNGAFTLVPIDPAGTIRINGCYRV